MGTKWKRTAGEMEEQKNSMKDRLAGYFILVTGFSLLICVFTLVFHTIYGHQYKTAIQRLILLNTFSENLDLMNENVQFYARYEDKRYYETAQNYIEKMQETLRSVYEEEQELAILRQIEDVSEMTEALGEQIRSIHIENDSDRRIDTLQFFHQKLEEIENVCVSLSEEAKLMNRLELSCLDSAYVKMEERSKLFNWIFALIFGIICLCMFIQIQGFSRAISQPIYALIQGAEQICSNGLNKVTPIETSGKMVKELKLLTEVFNDMVGQLKQQIEMVEENARVHQMLLESKFKELQMQINPHFLFNTLNMIADNAYMEQAERTEQLLLSAARMFRFSLDFSGKPVPLFREIEELGNYVFIQEQRYGKKIVFEFALDEVFHHIKIPSLILQPLVENAIIHGVERQRETARILIKTRYCPEEVCGYISVEDNGIGMDEAELETIRSHIEQYSGETMKIGLGNVYLRLRMFFKETCLMKIESVKNEGTKVTIRIPCKEICSCKEQTGAAGEKYV